MQVSFVVMMFVIGAAVGSFLCCQARRMRLKEEGYKKSLGKRSVCLNCQKQLKWYENVPIISWLCLRGKCSKCGKKIGILELLAEIGCGMMTAMISATIDVTMASWMEWVIWGFVMIFGFVLIFLAIYDGAYGELPSLCLTISAICAIIVAILKQWSLVLVDKWTPESLVGIMGAVMMLGGVYLLLYVVSRGKWVGDGDWILAGVIGLVLGSAWLALIALCVANLVACIVMLPAVVKCGKKVVYFGPFLVIAFVVVYTFAEMLESLI